MEVVKSVFKNGLGKRSIEEVAVLAGVSPEVMVAVGEGKVPQRVAIQKKIARVLGVDRQKLFVEKEE